MSAYKLVLSPQLSDDQWVSSEQIEGIIAALRNLQFLSHQELIDERVTRYLLGDACLSQLTFLGCSPHIELDPPEHQPLEAARQGKFCHLTISQFEIPVWRVDPSAKPRCPQCRKASRQQDMLIADELRCPNCSELTPATRWQWRSLAGRGRFFLDIWGVFTSEAVPNPSLLDTLKEVVGVDWKYFLC